jgi:hypothetical protein
MSALSPAILSPAIQPMILWPAAFVAVRSDLDQLVRNEWLSSARTSAIDGALDAAVEREETLAKDGARVTAMAGAR